MSENSRGNTGWDNAQAHEIQIGHIISAVKHDGVGTVMGKVEFIEQRGGKVRWRLTNGSTSVWYNTGGTLGRRYE